MNVWGLMMGCGISVASAASGFSAGGPPEPALRDLCGAVEAVEMARLDAVPLDPSDISPADLDPDIIAARSELIEVAARACGWPTIPVVSYEYGYDFLAGDSYLPDKYVFNLDNSTGQEKHDLKIYEVNEAAEDMTIPEILDRDDWEELLTLKGFASALPGTTDNSGPVILTVGRWAAVCFVDVGTTSEMLAEILETGEPLPDADDPHWRHGQTAEFWVEA